MIAMPASHPRPTAAPPASRARPPGGPGTELKRLLASAGFAPGDCACEARARQMDEMGADWCDANSKLIVGWLAEEARKLVVPLPELAAWVMVRAAIAAARRKTINAE